MRCAIKNEMTEEETVGPEHFPSVEDNMRSCSLKAGHSERWEAGIHTSFLKNDAVLCIFFVCDSAVCSERSWHLSP